MGRWCQASQPAASRFMLTFKEQQSHEHTAATPEAQTYLVDCNSEGNGRACSVRSHPGSCWSWGWTASADAGIFPHRPGHEKHAALRQSADSAKKKAASPRPPVALRQEPTSDIHLERGNTWRTSTQDKCQGTCLVQKSRRKDMLTNAKSTSATPIFSHKLRD